jgi:hypothetical protein
LPFCDYTIRVPENKLRFKDLCRKEPLEKPLKLGQYLKNRRLNLSLNQEQAAQELQFLWSMSCKLYKK